MSGANLTNNLCMRNKLNQNVIFIIPNTRVRHRRQRNYGGRKRIIDMISGKKNVGAITNYFPHTLPDGNGEDDKSFLSMHNYARLYQEPREGDEASESSNRNRVKVFVPSSQSKVNKKNRRRKINGGKRTESPKKEKESRTKHVTDFFPVRRSVRKCHSKLLTEKKKDFEEAILSNKEDGLQVETFEDKGRGVKATKRFLRGDFVVEYTGELISHTEAKWRERIYAADENTGCYMYYFSLNNKHYCVDATAETKHLGRLINHSRNGNLATKPFVVDNIPHLILIAKKDIEPGEELLYDYGDRAKTSLMFYPWLAT